MRSPVLPPMRMNAADTSASSAIAPCTPLTVVPRSSTTAEIDTFISDVSTTRTNIAIARSSASRPLNGTVPLVSASMAQPSTTGRPCGPPVRDETLTGHGVGGRRGDRDAAERADAAGGHRAEPRLRGHGPPGRDAGALTEGHDAGLGRRPAGLPAPALPRHGRQPGRQPGGGGERRRPDPAQG